MSAQVAASLSDLLARNEHFTRCLAVELDAVANAAVAADATDTAAGPPDQAVFPRPNPGQAGAQLPAAKGHDDGAGAARTHAASAPAPCSAALRAARAPGAVAAGAASAAASAPAASAAAGPPGAAAAAVTPPAQNHNPALAAASAPAGQTAPARGAARPARPRGAAALGVGLTLLLVWRALRARAARQAGVLLRRDQLAGPASVLLLVLTATLEAHSLGAGREGR